jgi:hypothetical protein
LPDIDGFQLAAEVDVIVATRPAGSKADHDIVWDQGEPAMSTSFQPLSPSPGALVEVTRAFSQHHRIDDFRVRLPPAGGVACRRSRGVFDASHSDRRRLFTAHHRVVLVRTPEVSVLAGRLVGTSRVLLLRHPAPRREE